MQYKIPIHIENEDTIIFDLSLRQMGIIIAGLVIAFGLFNKLQGIVPQTPLVVVCVAIAMIFFFVAKFNSHEMTFLPFLLNTIRFRVNGNGAYGEGRVWIRGVDSYSALKIGYVQPDVIAEKSNKHVKDTGKLAEQVKNI